MSDRRYRETMNLPKVAKGLVVASGILVGAVLAIGGIGNLAGNGDIAGLIGIALGAVAIAVAAAAGKAIARLAERVQE